MFPQIHPCRSDQAKLPKETENMENAGQQHNSRQGSLTTSFEEKRFVCSPLRNERLQKVDHAVLRLTIEDCLT